MIIMKKSVHIINELHFGLDGTEVVLLQLCFLRRGVRRVFQLHLPLLGLPLKLLSLHHQCSEVFPLLQFLDLAVESRALGRDTTLVLLPQFLEVIRVAEGCLLFRFLLAPYLSLLDLATDVLLEQTVVLLPLLPGICFRFGKGMLVSGGDGGIMLTVCDSVGRGKLPVTLLLGIKDLQHFVSFGGINGGFEVLLYFKTIGLFLGKDGLSLCFLLSLFGLGIHHFLQDEVSKLALVYLFIQLLLEQVFLLLCQFHFRLLSLPILPPQFLITLLMHFQHFHVEGFVLSLFILEGMVSFSLLLLETGLVLLLTLLVEGFQLLVVLQELLVVEFLRLGLLGLFLLGLLLIGEFADEALMLGQSQLLLSLLLFLPYLRLQHLSLLTELFQSLLLLLPLTLFLTDKLLRHLGFDAIGVEFILIQHLQGTVFGMFVQLELH